MGESLIWQPAIYLANKFSLSLSLSVRFYCYFIHVYFLLVLWTNKRIRICAQRWKRKALFIYFLTHGKYKLDGWQLSGRIAMKATHRKTCTLLQQLNLYTFVTLFISGAFNKLLLLTRARPRGGYNPHLSPGPLVGFAQNWWKKFGVRSWSSNKLLSSSVNIFMNQL